MRNLIRCIPTVVVAGVWTAQVANAQEPAQPPTQTQPRTHTVVRGDNLWDLSQLYLGNPFLWPEIYRLNRDVVEDPHWIYPGEVLRLPGAETEVVQVPAPLPEAVPVVREAPLEIRAFPRVEQPVEAPTVTTGATAGFEPRPTVRQGEVLSAPYVDREGGPRGFGRILAPADIAGVAEARLRSRFQLHDRVLIQPPAGQIAPEGERYLAYRLGPVLDDLGQVVIPTGVIEVTRAPRSNTAAVALVVRAFEDLSAEDRLIPIDTAGIFTTERPVPVADGRATTIAWVYGEPVLPSIQNFIVLGVSAREGIRLGDEFVIYMPSEQVEDGRPADPEVLIAKAQVVRSTSYGVTAIIVGQWQPAIKEGMSARVIARMPSQ